jgi:chromosome segregation ATPase
MSAVDEYRKHTELSDWSKTEDLADAAIAELEAEVKEHIEREYEQRQRARKAEAELAALKAENQSIARQCTEMLKERNRANMRAEQAEAAMVDATHLAAEMSQKLIDAEAYVAQAEAQRDICHASAADWHGQALLLQDELAALKEQLNRSEFGPSSDDD